MSEDRRPLAIAVMGPTASGKTAFAIELAERHGGEIVSVDSALVYRGLDIGAAKPDAGLRSRVPHHLLDLRDPWRTYSAAEFAADARAAVAAIVQRGCLPILAGGTGLYFRALLQGLSSMPQADPGVRAEIMADAQARGWAALHKDLARIDPVAAARILATDTQRLQRALEVFRLTGRPISDWQRQPSSGRLPLRVLKLILSPDDRTVLHARIEQRFDTMLAAGFLDEVRRLRTLPELRQAVRPLDLPALRAVGYRQAWEYLDGQGDARAFRDKSVFATRQLAKRQITWLRSELDARWFDPERSKAELVTAVGLFLGN
ncbi:MAG: tRNA (adenosine(37)-N6)-dimethylallyltransferase MiaA [Xanthomonadaceae bacterium]|jgi:tRNA dimethylallyltransferase|nr:tRNA (adenosine(37)-N6)-dimethylallyltransferase MiaA [Xanthomonadaceae bacterium]